MTHRQSRLTDTVMQTDIWSVSETTFVFSAKVSTLFCSSRLMCASGNKACRQTNSAWKVMRDPDTGESRGQGLKFGQHTRQSHSFPQVGGGYLLGSLSHREAIGDCFPDGFITFRECHEMSHESNLMKTTACLTTYPCFLDSSRPSRIWFPLVRHLRGI